MKVLVKGVGDVNLTKSDFVASGGEGEIYARGGFAYKIYHKPERMIPVAKIGELSVIDDQTVIRPQQIILDKNDDPIGYTMRYVKNTHSLCQLFTKAFRDRNGVTHDIILDLVRGMQKTVEHIHSKRILIVDLNEMNFLVDSSFKETYFIDVDSYQTKSFPATAIMESIRDRHSKTFSSGTDWFSFAVVSFQLFIGIHPYKGKHPNVTNIEDRMLKNISVFNKDVGIPKVCYPFDVIPPVYLDWYKAVLDRGERIQPPFDLQARIAITHTIKQTLGGDKFDIKQLFHFGELITAYYNNCGTTVVTTETRHHSDKMSYPRAGSVSKIAFTRKMNKIVEGYLVAGILKFYNLTDKEEVGGSQIAATSLMSYQGRMYALSGDNVLELDFIEMSQNVVASTRVAVGVFEKTTKMFEGVVVQNLLGSYFISIFPAVNTSYQIKIPELQEYKIVDAKFDGRVLFVIGSKKGVYDKLIFRFNRDYDGYDVRVDKDITTLDINFVMLDHGVVASINDREKLELFPIVGPDVKVIDSDAISSDMKLYKNGTQVLFARDNELFSLKMK